jgi:plastocyanin
MRLKKSADRCIQSLLSVVERSIRARLLKLSCSSPLSKEVYSQLMRLVLNHHGVINVRSFMKFTMKLIAKSVGFMPTIGLFCSQILAGTVQVTVLDKEGKPAPDAVVVLQHATVRNLPMQLPTQATITNEKMQFMPAVSVVAKGAKVRFVNNDPWDHHVRGAPASSIFSSNTPAAYSAAAETGGFELRLEGKSEGKPAKFVDVTMDKVGVQSAAVLGCFLHGSMRGHVYVSDSPWAAKTNAEGVASFENVPDGAVQVRVWHADQLVDLPLQSVNVTSAPLQVKSQLQVTPRRRRG